MTASVAPTAAQLSLRGALVVRNILGEERAVEHAYPDGSYECPFCHYAVQGTLRGCPNPACTARVDERTGELDYPRERAERERTASGARASEEAERLANVEWSRQWREDQRTEQAARRMDVEKEAIARGACVRCALKDFPYRPPVFTKHRKECPLEVRARTPRGGR